MRAVHQKTIRARNLVWRLSPQSGADWNRTRGFGRYFKSSLWMIPFIAIPIELVTTRFLHALDAWLDWSVMGFAAEGAKAMLQTIITAALSFTVFTFGFLLVAIQVASGQLTPRIIATTLLRDDVVRYAVGLFLFALMFAVSALNQMGSNPHQLVLFVAAIFGITCFAVFLYVIDYTARLLRPISILTRLGKAGLVVIERVYPEFDHGPQLATAARQLGAPARIVQHRASSEIVIAVNIKALVDYAHASNGVIELVPQVGDFVAADEPLFHLYGGASAVDDARLRAAVVFGPERTIEQDPAFAFRVIIDIAQRALSAAINDPTTAVLAIDQLHRLLRAVGIRQLHTDEVYDNSGTVCAILRTPNWDDFVHLTFTEIRRDGSRNLQVARRLRSMIDNLMQTLPEHRHPALREQLDLLEREIELTYAFKEDIALARQPDSQGLGGRSGKWCDQASPAKELPVVALKNAWPPNDRVSDLPASSLRPGARS